MPGLKNCIFDLIIISSKWLMICGSKLNEFYLWQIILVSFTLMTGCSGDRTVLPEVSYTDPAPDSCISDPGHRYFISMPERIDAGHKLPLIIAIDPHGDGQHAVKKFAGSLTGIPAIIVGSGKIRNNYEGFEASIIALRDEVQARYPVDPERFIIAGFSGGARMAYYFGMNHKVCGIIMYGAGPGRVPAGAMTKRLYAVSGTRDFNFMEQYVPPFSAMNGGVDYFTDYFRGTHEWPPSGNIYESVVYVLRDSPDMDESVLKDITDRFLNEYDSLLKANDLFFAGKALEKAWHFVPGTKDKEKITEKIDAFKKMPAFTEYQEKFESFLSREIKLKQAYAGRLSDPDTAWWRREVSSLQNNLGNCTDSMQADYFYRLKGFTGIILYSQINDLLRQGIVNEQVWKLLVIYEQAEPVSADLFYFKALVQHLTGHDREARELLDEATKRGFSDPERIKRDFIGML